MRWLIDGCYGDGNVGDECLLRAVVERIRCVDNDSQISAFSADSPTTTAETGLPTFQQCNPFGRNLYGSVFKGLLRQIVEQIRRCDVFVLGGGELFRDDVGLSATLGMFYRMRIARWLGKRVLALGVGAQRPTTWWGRQILRSALRDAEAVVSRDQDSMRVAQELAPGLSTASCTPDLVFSLDGDHFREPALGRECSADPLRIGVAVKSLPVGHARHSDVHNRLPETLTHALSTYALGRQCRVSVLPFAESDVIEATRLSERLRTAGLNVSPPTPPQVLPLQQAISQVDCLLAVPLHASVFAFASGVPALGLAYDAKIFRLYKSFGMESRCFPVNGLDAARLEHGLQNMVGQRRTLSMRLVARAERAEGGARLTVERLLAPSALGEAATARDSASIQLTKHLLRSFRTLCRTGTPARQSTIDGQECPSYVLRFCSKTCERVLTSSAARTPR